MLRKLNVFEDERPVYDPETDPLGPPPGYVRPHGEQPVANDGQTYVQHSARQSPSWTLTAILIVVAVAATAWFAGGSSSTKAVGPMYGEWSEPPVEQPTTPAHMIVPTAEPVAHGYDLPALRCDHAQWEQHQGRLVANYSMGQWGGANSWYADPAEIEMWRGMSEAAQQNWLLHVCGEQKPGLR